MKSLSEKDTRRPALTRAAAPSCGEARIRGSQGCHRLLSPCVAASVIGHGVLRRPENLRQPCPRCPRRRHQEDAHSQYEVRRARAVCAFT